MTRMRFHHTDRSGRVVRLVTRDPVAAVEHLRQRGAVGDRVLRIPDRVVPAVRPGRCWLDGVRALAEEVS